MSFKAVIFDLDGVITDTAEFHFLAWQQLAEENKISFTREDNEHLRGVSRRDSLLFILSLDDRQVDESTLQEMMSRKNALYINMLENISSSDLLPGVSQLLDGLEANNIPFGLGSASKNAVYVLERLGIKDRFQVIADGHAPGQKKPAPDLFLFAANQLDVEPDVCLVIEDAASGVLAAQRAGISVLALGPTERFGELLSHPNTYHRQNLAGFTAVMLQQLGD